MRPTLLIFETHPVQYRAPVYQELERLLPGSFEVIYASDCSVRGYRDSGFGETFAWDIPLLKDYPFRVLNNERGAPLSSWGSLTGRGIYRLLSELRPRAILMHSFSYRYDLAVFAAATWLRIPIWIRVETQDEAFERGLFKEFTRHAVYRPLYAGVKKAFYIGELNRQHLLRHGMKAKQLIPARYCTPNRVAELSTAEKAARRARLRERLELAGDRVVVAFFGKLIPKKDPGLLLEAIKQLPASISDRIALLFVGAGELEHELRNRTEDGRGGWRVKTVFAGFVNQAALPDYYLATDIAVLPSRRMGETWGLVVNEALQAGCSAIVSEAVGCHRDFQSLARFRVIPVGDSRALANAIQELTALPRDFEWAREKMGEYSIEAAAKGIAGELQRLLAERQS